MNSPKKIVIIGAGFGGMSSAAYLAKQGHDVTVVEKNRQVGGRAQVLKTKGFTFDLGPSWYMMPDVFEDFFADFNAKPSDYYTLKRLAPHYTVVGNDRILAIGDRKHSRKIFKSIEPESSQKLEDFLEQAKRDYQLVRQNILEKPMHKKGQVLESQRADNQHWLPQYLLAASSH